MTSSIKLGNLVIEGKTKKVFDIEGDPDHVLVESKDRITAGDGVKAHDMAGKATISTATTSYIFEYLNTIGIETHFSKMHVEKSFIAKKCDMIPIEWVARRYATGSFLKRNPGVKEGYKFTPLKLEMFYKREIFMKVWKKFASNEGDHVMLLNIYKAFKSSKNQMDDANHDPQWSYEQLIGNELVIGGVLLGKHEVDIMLKTTACIFEVLEKAWNTLNCNLIDMKVEFGVTTNGKILLADVIDSDSWRLWPSGDKRLMVDKQVYRNLKEVTPEDLERVKNNFKWVSEQVKSFLQPGCGRVVIIMGSPSDIEYCQKIQNACKRYNIPCQLRISSAHKGTDETLKMIAEYEGDNRPTVFIAVAGRSNGLGPVTSGNTAFPVINCPPISTDWGREDIWSSLRLPSGLGCATVLSGETAALHAAQILALSDHIIWSSLRVQQLMNFVSLKVSDKNLNATDKNAV